MKPFERHTKSIFSSFSRCVGFRQDIIEEGAGVTGGLF
jgi:hypothetical protein